MIAVDTNVLVRFLQADDAEQSLRAERFLLSAAQRGDALFVSQIVLCELAWVLASVYRLGRRELANILQAILRSTQLTTERSDLGLAALRRFRAGPAGFSDYLLSEVARDRGYRTLATFDEALLQEPGSVSP